MNSKTQKIILILTLMATALLLPSCIGTQKGNESSEIASTIARTKLMNYNLTNMLDQLIGSKSYHLTVSAVLNQSESVEELAQLEPLKITGQTKQRRSTNKEITSKDPSLKKLYIKNKGRLLGLAKEMQQKKMVKSMPGFPKFTKKKSKKSRNSTKQNARTKETVTDTKSEESVYYNEKRTQTVYSSNN
ncbi:hypothetical protein DID80_02365, partial [Candidatus Marinamargulisbacteria bacterium SCGC AAA071-K20]